MRGAPEKIGFVVNASQPVPDSEVGRMDSNVQLQRIDFGDESESIGKAWNSLRTGQEVFVPTFEDFRNSNGPEGTALRGAFIVASSSGRLVGLSAFVLHECRIPFIAGRNLLFSATTTALDLIGGRILGECSSGTMASMLIMAMRYFSKAQLLRTGELKIGDGLFNALEQLPFLCQVARTARKDAIHWQIKLPDSIEEYMASLGKSTRQNLRREVRKLQALGSQFKVFTSANEIDRFLSDAEKVSERTYQWTLGSKLRADSKTRSEFLNISERGQFRCYLLYLNDEPCAFVRGRIVSGVFDFQSTGYIPALSKLSPGAVLLLLVIHDLIESTNVTLFDFGVGGDNLGYKSRFGNYSFAAASFLVANHGSPKGLWVVLLRRGLSSLLNFIAASTTFWNMVSKGKAVYLKGGERD